MSNAQPFWFRLDGCVSKTLIYFNPMPSKGILTYCRPTEGFMLCNGVKDDLLAANQTSLNVATSNL